MMLKDCVKCDLSINRTNVLIGYGARDALIYMVNDVPTYYDDKFGKPFAGHKSGKLLHDLLAEYSFDESNIYFTSIIRCKLDKDLPLTQNQVKLCMPYLVDEVKNGTPKIFITFGKLAFTNIYNKPVDFKDALGKVFKMKSVLIVPLPNLSYIYSNSEQIVYLEDTIKKLYVIYKSKYDIFHDT